MFDPRTRNELVVEALDILGKTAAGQPPAAEDLSVVNGQVDPMLAQLIALEIAYVQDADAIPAEFFNSLGAWLAWLVAPAFGVPRGSAQDPTSLLSMKLQAERDLKLMRRSRYGGNVVAGDFGYCYPTNDSGYS